MTAYLLDTNHAGVLLDPDAPLWRRIEAATDAEFSLCRPSVGELWFMVFNSARVESNRRRLEELLSEFSVWELDEPAAIEFGRIKADLRRAGRPIPDIDIQIASIARCNGLVLLSADKHFSSVPELAVENWL